VIFPLMGDVHARYPIPCDCEPLFWFGFAAGAAAAVLLVLGAAYIFKDRP
jgi:hypothetical protein